MNEFDFKDRTAVITGGGQGFGLDIAKRFLNSGAKVIIWDIDEKLLKSAIENKVKRVFRAIYQILFVKPYIIINKIQMFLKWFYVVRSKTCPKHS